MIEDPLIVALDLSRPITAAVLERAISFHQTQADIHLANVAALQKAYRLYREGFHPNPALQESARRTGGE